MLIKAKPYIGYLGILNHQEPQDNVNALTLLIKYLVNFYNPDHQAYLYEATKYPNFEPIIKQLTLDELPTAKLSPLTTLYIPPAYKSQTNQELLSLLDRNNKEELK